MKLHIQSISDIITNSSSEVFLEITSGEQSALNTIFDLLKNYFPEDDADLYPVVNMESHTVYLSLPYGIDSWEFFVDGIRAILENKLDKNTFELIRCD